MSKSIKVLLLTLLVLMLAFSAAFAEDTTITLDSAASSIAKAYKADESTIKFDLTSNTTTLKAGNESFKGTASVDLTGLAGTDNGSTPLTVTFAQTTGAITASLDTTYLVNSASIVITFDGTKFTGKVGMNEAVIFAPTADATLTAGDGNNAVTMTIAKETGGCVG